MTPILALLVLLSATPAPQAPACSFHKRWTVNDPAVPVLDLTIARVGGPAVKSTHATKEGVCVHTVQLVSPFEGTAGFTSGSEWCPRLPTLFQYVFDSVTCTLTVKADSTKWVYR